MDIENAIKNLCAERDRINRLIGILEEFQRTGVWSGTPKRRGRKFMGAEDRKEVSERMRRYWANRRAEKATSASPETLRRAAAATVQDNTQVFAAAS